jgi:hypothetical protein
MPRTYDEGSIKCPFYIAMATKSITCEGITDECTTKLLFTTIGKRDLHREIFCECNYSKCEVNRMLEKKYEDTL